MISHNIIDNCIPTTKGSIVEGAFIIDNGADLVESSLTCDCADLVEDVCLSLTFDVSLSGTWGVETLVNSLIVEIKERMANDIEDSLVSRKIPSNRNIK